MKRSRYTIVTIINTNTAAYAYDVSLGKAPFHQLDTTKTFLAELGPYLTDFAIQVTGDRRGFGQVQLDQLKSSILTIEQLLDSLNDVLFGAFGIHDIRIHALAAIHTMRSTGAVRGAAEDLRDWLAEGSALEEQADSNESLLSLISRLSGLYVDLSSATSSLPSQRSQLHDKRSSLSQFDSLLATARSALIDAEQVMDLAYDTEELVRITIQADTVWTAPDTIRVSLDTGTTLALTISARNRVEVNRLANDGPYTLSLTFQPDWPLRPSVGLSFIYSPSSTFGTFGTIADSSVTVVSTGKEDSRYTYGLTLGLIPRGLDRRATSGWAAGLDLTINPSGNVHAFAVGPGISWRWLKAGVGALWTKHTELDGLAVGDTLASPDGLRIRENLWVSEILFQRLPPRISPICEMKSYSS